ncbi:hypothetical protein Tco_0605441 [Tanacetum coccineum]
MKEDRKPRSPSIFSTVLTLDGDFKARKGMRLNAHLDISSSLTSAMSLIWSKNCTCLAIDEHHLPIESTIARRSTDVMVDP